VTGNSDGGYSSVLQKTTR